MRYILSFNLLTLLNIKSFLKIIIEIIRKIFKYKYLALLK